jgi:glucose-1-phosphate thymidylyltransferase
MIYYPLHTLAQCGLRDIMIVSGKGHAGHFLELLGSGKEFGVRLSYAIQEEAGGIAQALGLCEDFADNENVAVILGDNIFQDNLRAEIDSFAAEGSSFVPRLRTDKLGAKVFLKKVDDPQRFGVPEIDGERVARIEEKPQSPKSSYAVTGLYLYDNRVWNVIKTLKPSGRGELEITDVNNFYINDGSMKFVVVGGWWTDAGTFESLLQANNLVSQAGIELNF